MSFPEWLQIVAVISLVTAGISAVIIIIDLFTAPPQHMWIMNLVWPITALYLGPLAVLIYFLWGRSKGHGGHEHQQHHEHDQHHEHEQQHQHEQQPAKKPFWSTCIVATTHCGSGCVLGDIIAEWGLFLFPMTLFGSRLLAGWTADYILAYLIGIAFQYFTLRPMQHLSARETLVKALKADTVSITFWQIGMYGWMAITKFLIFGHEPSPLSPVFWFMMQLAMWLGFVTSFPSNAWLLKRGIKEGH